MKKKFDAVKFQREARARLTERYRQDPGRFVEELREKYAHLQRRGGVSHTSR